MRRRLAVILVVVSIGGLAASAPAGAEIVECGHYDYGAGRWYQDMEDVNGAGIFDVVGRDVSCGTARRISRKAYDTNLDGRRRWRYGRWSCRWRATGYESANLRCVRGKRLVRWTTAA